MTHPYRDPPAETQGCGLLVVALVVGPLIGFFGPILLLERAAAVIEYPGETTYAVALGLPILCGLALLFRPVSRPWGVALLTGVVLGELALWVLFLSLCSQVCS